MKTLKEYKEEMMKNPEFAHEYVSLQPEFEIIGAMIDARNRLNTTREELAERAGISMPELSVLENDTLNSSIGLLQRLAEGMGMTLKIEFVPKEGETSGYNENIR